jgi:hypothetical protein
MCILDRFAEVTDGGKILNRRERQERRQRTQRLREAAEAYDVEARLFYNAHQRDIEILILPHLNSASYKRFTRK